MLGAIIGDIVGSSYEVINVYKRSEIKPFKNRLIPILGQCRFTDDSVLTIAVARALVKNANETNSEILEKQIAESLKHYTKKYPLKRQNGSLYGDGYERWAKERELRKRETYIDERGHAVSTNGAAMRVASVGWLYSSIEDVLDKAKNTAIYTHGTEESIQAAQAIALAIFLARTTKDKEIVAKELKEILNYEIDFSKENISTQIAQIRSASKKCKSRKKMEVNCDAKTTSYYAIYAFLISSDFVDCIKTAISFGGDSDTIACMAGAIAEAYYGIPQEWVEETYSVLVREGCYEDDITFIREFRERYCM